MGVKFAGSSKTNKKHCFEASDRFPISILGMHQWIRYGKKDGKNRKDLLKAIHYIVLLMSSEDESKKKEDTNE